jgi:hypothetical protein
VPHTLANPLLRERAAIRKDAAKQSWDAPAPLRLWHLASLDAPTVAVVWALGFAWAADVRLPVWIPILLALAAWTVYIADRLLDAHFSLRTGETHRLRLRHHFHWRHRRILIPLAIAATLAAAWIVLTLMPAAARERDSVLAAAAMAYFTRVHSRSGLAFQPSTRSPVAFPFKELLVGFLFTAACVLPAWSRSYAASAPWPLLAPAVFFALLAWLNCHAIETWESAPASACRQSVFLRGCLLALIGFAMAAVVFHIQPRINALLTAGALSALLLALLDRMRNLLTPLALRVAADLVLLTPVFLVALAPSHR